MIKAILLITGFLVLLFQQYVQPIPLQVQYIFFFIGIVLLGVPHGAADLLVASQNARNETKSFSKLSFFVNYLSRLIFFGIVLYVSPLVGYIAFIIFAAYHFGETDLHQFKTKSLVGKLFVISYGLLILGVILLNHFDEVKPIFTLFDRTNKYLFALNYIENNRYTLLLFLALLFFVSAFLYFLINKLRQSHPERFLLHFIFILFILYHLPMILGFTFYFVVWHSVLSLNNIVNYLRKDGQFTSGIIVKQIFIYSAIALGGIALMGLSKVMFGNINAMMSYVFIGLAVLTAPHMQIMHNMYLNIGGYKRILPKKLI